MRHIAFVVPILLASVLTGCQPRQSNDPIVTSVAENEVAAVQRYLEEGGDPNMKTRDGKPLLFIASGPKGGEDVAKLLLDAGADPNAATEDGRTPLHNAAAWCDVEMVQLLIAGGVNLTLANGDGETALDVVCKSPADRRSEVNGILIEAAAQRE